MAGYRSRHRRRDNLGDGEQKDSISFFDRYYYRFDGNNRLDRRDINQEEGNETIE